MLIHWHQQACSNWPRPMVSQHGDKVVPNYWPPLSFTDHCFLCLRPVTLRIQEIVFRKEKRGRKGKENKWMLTRFYHGREMVCHHSKLHFSDMDKPYMHLRAYQEEGFQEKPNQKFETRPTINNSWAPTLSYSLLKVANTNPYKKIQPDLNRGIVK